MKEGIIVDQNYYTSSKGLPDYTGDRARYPVGPVPYSREDPLLFGLYSKVQKYF